VDFYDFHSARACKFWQTRRIENPMRKIEILPVSYTLWAKDKAAFAQAFGRSFAETGFAIIADHSIPSDVIREADKATKAFFDLSTEIKLKYSDPENGFQRGYSPIGTENAKGNKISDFKEFWHTGRHLDQNSPYREVMKETPQVTDMPTFNLATRKLYEALDDFGFDLLQALAIYLNIEPKYFDDKVNVGNSILRLLHYPAHDTPPPSGSMRAAEHEDINLITLLLGAEEAGLQAQHRNGNWLDVKAPDGALVVNAGDMLQRLTAGVIPSTTHRVLNPTPERASFSRYSKPFFLHPNQDFMITPLPGCVAKTGQSEPPISAGDYLNERLCEIGLLKKAG